MEGYARFAAMMGLHPEMAIFRAFRALNTKNLLYLQAELVELERDLEVISELDGKSGNAQKEAYARSWSALSRSAEQGDGLQLHKVLTIREKLKQYNDTLLQQSLLFGLEKPSTSEFDFLHQWLSGTKMSGCFLVGREQHVWDEEKRADLVTLRKAQGPKDALSSWLTGSFVDYFHRSVGHYIMAEPQKPIAFDAESGITNYNDSTLLAAADIVGTVIASLLPISSIIVLYFVKSMPTRLGVVAAFTALFSITLAIVTQARRIEVFAATAASVYHGMAFDDLASQANDSIPRFASVQVVFIGTTNGG